MAAVGLAEAGPVGRLSRALESSLAGCLRLAPIAAIELASKVEVFGRFSVASSSIESREELGAKIRRTRDLDAWPALWTVEGLGHGLAAAACRRSGLGGRLLSDLRGRAVPAGAWLPLHTGMGLGLAQRALEGASGDRDVGGRVRRFEEACLEGSRPGYAGAAFEGLGFVARTLHPRLVPAVDRVLDDHAPERALSFWHGVGRGLYFLPLHAMPGGTAAALAHAATTPPSAGARANAVAGVAWALTLVNLRHGEVLATVAELLRTELGRTAREAFARGAGAALAVWTEWTRAPLAAGRYDPTWVLSNRRARREFDDALARCRQGRVEEVFRCT